MLTTGAMAKMGYVYGNLMVNLHLKNNKLLHRGVLILESLAHGNDAETGMETLKKAGMSVPLALIILKAGKQERGGAAPAQAPKATCARQLKDSDAQSLKESQAGFLQARFTFVAIGSRCFARCIQMFAQAPHGAARERQP